MKWFWKVVKTVTIVVPLFKGIIKIWTEEESGTVPPVLK